MVLDVFCAESANTLHIFIVLKSARVHVWRFLRPGFEWSFLTKVELSVSRNVQVTSTCFDRKSRYFDGYSFHFLACLAKKFTSKNSCCKLLFETLPAYVS